MDKQQLRELLEKATPGPLLVSHGSTDDAHTFTVDALRSGGMGEVVFKTSWVRNKFDLVLYAELRNHASELLEAAERAEHFRACWYNSLNDVAELSAKLEQSSLEIEQRRTQQIESDAELAALRPAEAQRDRLAGALRLIPEIICPMCLTKVPMATEEDLNQATHNLGTVEAPDYRICKAARVREIAAEALKEAGNGE